MTSTEGWRGRSVLVTGAGGFIGSHLTEALVREGAIVRAVCSYRSDGSLGWLSHAGSPQPRTAEICRGDIRDERFVDDCFKGIEIAFHLAALVAIPYSYVAPRSFIETNVIGTANVLEAARRHSTRRLVHTSTSEVYGTPDVLPIKESHSLKGQSPYSATKIAADKLCEAYARSFDVPVVVLRPFNTYGPRQSIRAIIPAILAQLLAGRPRVQLGSLTPGRDLVFVDDTVAAFLRAGLTPDIEGLTIHLGTGRMTSVQDVFRIACELTGRTAEVEQREERIRPSNSEVESLQSDPSFARERLNWQSTVALEDGMRRTSHWVGEHLDLFDITAYGI